MDVVIDAGDTLDSAVSEHKPTIFKRMHSAHGSIYQLLYLSVRPSVLPSRSSFSYDFFGPVDFDLFSPRMAIGLDGDHCNSSES